MSDVTERVGRFFTLPRYDAPPAAFPVTASDIASGAVTESILADASVATAKLQDGAVTAAKLGAGVVPDAIFHQPLAGYDGVGLSGGGVRYGVEGGNGTAQSRILAPVAITITKLVVECNVPSGTTYTAYLYKNDVATGIGGSLVGTGTYVVGTFTGTVSLAAGDGYYIQYTRTTGSGNGYHNAATLLGTF